MLLFGPPGAGKGTQAQLLRDLWRVSHISSGDLFRRHVQEETPLGLKAVEFIDQGLLVPDEVTIGIVLEMVLSLSVDQGFILDGFPRNINQAEVLEEALERRSRGLDKVLHIDVLEVDLVQRLRGRFSCRRCQAPQNVAPTPVGGGTRGGSDEVELKCQQCGGELYQRTDDSPEAIRQRIEEYRRETKPLLGFYRRRNLLVEVSGSGAIPSVNQRVLAALEHE